MIHRKIEEFQNMIPRLFPKETQNVFMGINGTSVKDITIQVTEDCNLRCTYCYQHDKTSNVLKIEDGKKFIDLILNSDEKSSKYIQSNECIGAVLNFIGGEPFLEIDTIDCLTDYFINKMIELNHRWLFRYRINIGTNGLLYFSDKVQKYIKKNKSHLGIGITVDGNKELHDKCRIDLNGNGSYDRAIAALLHYESTYHEYGTSKITISPDNIEYFYDSTVDLLQKELYDCIYANCVYEKGWTLDHAKILYNHYLCVFQIYYLGLHIQMNTLIAVEMEIWLLLMFTGTFILVFDILQVPLEILI